MPDWPDEGSLFGLESDSIGSNDEDDDLLASGYRRSEYHKYGATDEDIEFWSLAEPGAPSPEDAGVAAWDVLDQLDANGDGLIDDPSDDQFW